MAAPLEYLSRMGRQLFADMEAYLAYYRAVAPTLTFEERGIAEAMWIELRREVEIGDVLIRTRPSRTREVDAARQPTPAPAPTQ
jgi:hypothetical protein